EEVQNHMTKPSKLNLLVAKIEAVHTSPDIRKAPFDMTNSLQPELKFTGVKQKDPVLIN
ncbi:24621_t:CDS:2, partial [Gigaspora rosea]